MNNLKFFWVRRIDISQILIYINNYQKNRTSPVYLLETLSKQFVSFMQKMYKISIIYNNYA